MANDKDLTALVEGGPDPNPGGCDGSTIPVSRLDDHIRYTRQVLKGNLIVEHDLATGYHKFARGTTANRPANPTVGMRYVNTTLGIAEIWDGGAWQPELLALPSATVMLFRMAAPPVGWTRVVDATKTDSVIRVLLNGEVLADGGSWTISGCTVQSHTLTIAEMPAHTHDYERGLFSLAGGTAFAPNAGSGNNQATTSTGGGGGHVHPFASDGSWRPKAVDVIAASKD
jgi:hypothetical protein